MAAFNTAPVVVRRRSDGVIEIGDAPPMGVLTESVGLHGATVTVDLSRPVAIPYSQIDDASRALWWLQFIYGGAVADEVSRLDDPDGAAVESRPIAAPGFLAAPVLRFAVGLWLLHWWPSKDRAGIELTRSGERWLKIELGVLAWFAEDAFGGTLAANGLLVDQVQTVVQLASGDPGTARPLALVRAVIESVPMDDPTYEELAVLESAIRDSARAAAGTHWAAMQDTVRESEIDVPDGIFLPEYAYLGDDEPRGAVVSGVSTVEWGRVRPRLLGAAEDNVSWWVRQLSSQAATIEARVLVGDLWENGEAVYAAVYRNDGDAPDEVMVFEEDTDRPRELMAYAQIAPPKPGDNFRVAVFDEAAAVFDATGAAAGPTAVARTRHEREAVVEALRPLLGRLPPDLSDRAPYELDPFAPWPVPDLEWGDDGD